MHLIGNNLTKKKIIPKSHEEEFGRNPTDHEQCTTTFELTKRCYQCCSNDNTPPPIPSKDNISEMYQQKRRKKNKKIK